MAKYRMKLRKGNTSPTGKTYFVGRIQNDLSGWARRFHSVGETPTRQFAPFTSNPFTPC